MTAKEAKQLAIKNKDYYLNILVQEILEQIRAKVLRGKFYLYTGFFYIGDYDDRANEILEDCITYFKNLGYKIEINNLNKLECEFYISWE